VLARPWRMALAHMRGGRHLTRASRGGSTSPASRGRDRPRAHTWGAAVVRLDAEVLVGERRRR
jgi:hypothetical protein